MSILASFSTDALHCEFAASTRRTASLILLARAYPSEVAISFPGRNWGQIFKGETGVRPEWHCRKWRKGLGRFVLVAGFATSLDMQRGTPRRALSRYAKTAAEFAHLAGANGFDLP